MPDLFEEQNQIEQVAIRPLTDHLRPVELHEVVGQQHILDSVHDLELPPLISPVYFDCEIPS